MKPAPAKRPAKPDSTREDSDSVVEASSTTRIATTKLAPAKIAPAKLAPTKLAPTKIIPSQIVWLSPAQAETRLLNRAEPQYPREALAAHRAGDVVLEVQVAEDGSISSIRTLSGDPLLAAAATEAVRNWRYQPYRQHDHPAQFQTDVTLSFSLPN
jgi:TonB family protein